MVVAAQQTLEAEQGALQVKLNALGISQVGF